MGHVKNKYTTALKTKKKLIQGKIHNKVTNLAMSNRENKMVTNGNEIHPGKITTQNTVESQIKKTTTKNDIKSNKVKNDRELTAIEIKQLLENKK